MKTRDMKTRDKATGRYVHRHNHEKCVVCRARDLDNGKLRAEVAYLRRQFEHLRSRIDKLLAATHHSGGAKKF